MDNKANGKLKDNGAPEHEKHVSEPSFAQKALAFLRGRDSFAGSVNFHILFLLLCTILPIQAQAAEFSGTAYSETDASNTTASPNGWPSGTFFNQVEPIGRATLGGLKRWWDRSNCTVTSGGSAGAYTYTPSNITYPSAYVTAETYCFIANFTSAGNDTLNVNSLGAVPLYKASSSGLVKLAAGDIQTGAHIFAQYDGALNGSSGGFYVVGGLSVSTGALLAANNLSDLVSATTAQNNLLPSQTSQNGKFLTTNGTNVSWAANADFVISSATNSLSGDVSLANTSTYYDGPSAAQGSTGTWCAWGTVTVQQTTGGSVFAAKLSDGSTTIASAQLLMGATANLEQPIALSGCITSPAGNLRISVKDGINTDSHIRYNSTGLAKDSTITAIRIF